MITGFIILVTIIIALKKYSNIINGRMVFLAKVVILDGKLIKKRSHDYLSEVFDFPSYYGRNLDALYDCLTDIGVETEIHLINSRYVSLDLIDTFVDASCSSSFITFIEE